jgi:UDP-N-acetylmuramoylalanine-D-glutamate ligase
MNISLLQNLPKTSKIALIGLGAENLQFLTWLIKTVKINPDQIVIADQKLPNLENQEILKELKIPEINKVFGDNYLGILASSVDEDPNLIKNPQSKNSEISKNLEIKYVFKSPGIWSLKTEFVSFRSLNGQDSVLSPLVFFLAKFRDQIIGVTGTKGKTTTSSLITHLLTKKGFSVNYCGNTTGISPYNFWTDLESIVDENVYFVVELSSFQLQDLGFSKISPKVAVITNYFVDHLDQHGNKEEYWQSKNQLFLHQLSGDFLVANDQISPLIPSKIVNNSTQILVNSEMVQAINSQISHELIGEHNQINLSLAVLTVQIITKIVAKVNQKPNTIENENAPETNFLLNDFTDLIEDLAYYSILLRDFQNVQHRLELVKTKNFKTVKELENNELTVKFWDDGAATEPDAVIACVKSLTENNQKLWLWLTGVDKGGNLDELAEILLTKITKNEVWKITLCGQVGQNLWQKILEIQQNQSGNQTENQTEKFGKLEKSQKENLESWKNDWKNRIILAKSFRECLNSLNFVMEIASFENFYNGNLEMESSVNLVENLTKNLENSNLANQKMVLNIALSPVGSSFDEFSNYKERSQFWLNWIAKI